MGSLKLRMVGLFNSSFKTLYLRLKANFDFPISQRSKLVQQIQNHF